MSRRRASRSKAADAKKARRRKRKAVQDARWLSPEIHDVFTDVAARAELFDAVLLERGWTFDDVHSDDGLAAYYYEPSGVATVAGPDGEADVEGVTRIWFTYTVDGEPDDPDDNPDFPDLIHVVLVGTDDDYQFNDAELLAYLDVIQAYRLGEPVPAFE